MTWRSCGLWWYGRRSDPITTPEPDPLMIDAVRDMSMTREMGPQENGTSRYHAAETSGSHLHERIFHPDRTANENKTLPNLDEYITRMYNMHVSDQM